MPRAIVVGVVGDSGAGKTTLTRGLTRVIGDAHVTHVSADDYHRYDRKQRRELGVTPLHPDSNHLDILTQHMSHLRRGESFGEPDEQEAAVGDGRSKDGRGRTTGSRGLRPWA